MLRFRAIFAESLSGGTCQEETEESAELSFGTVPSAEKGVSSRTKNSLFHRRRKVAGVRLEPWRKDAADNGTRCRELLDKTVKYCYPKTR